MKINVRKIIIFLIIMMIFLIPKEVLGKEYYVAVEKTISIPVRYEISSQFLQLHSVARDTKTGKYKVNSSNPEIVATSLSNGCKNIEVTGKKVRKS